MLITFEFTLYILSMWAYPHKYASLFSISVGFYYYLRLASIAFNFIVSGLGFYYVRLIMNTDKLKRTVQDEAICTLALRMLFYPIIQAISRSGAAWYEFEV